MLKKKIAILLEGTNEKIGFGNEYTFPVLSVKDGSNIEARTNVALANTLSGLVESTSSCTSEHSIEHALSANHPELPHGAGLIMLSEAYYTFFANKVPDKFVAMARAMGGLFTVAPYKLSMEETEKIMYKAYK